MFELIEINGVRFFKSTLFRSKHAFSTRIGGVSQLPHTKGLNLAYGLGDEIEIVRQNVTILADAVGIDAKNIISVPQVHSNEVRRVSMADAGMGVFCDATFSCDGYVTDEVDLPIGVKTADCVPILLEARDECDNVIAVSAIHAGWRGTALKIAEEGVKKLCSLGASPQNIYAAIGPCIDECCYEVGIDFTEQIAQKLGQYYKNNYVVKKANGALYADLKGMNFDILVSIGVDPENIDVCERCTCCDEELFYSHRRQKGIRGTHLNVIVK